MEKLLYCFGSGDDGGADDGDTGDTGVSASVAAGGRGWGPSRGEGDNDQSSNDSQDRRVDSRGNTTNFNIDRSQPSVTADVNGVTRTVYGSQANLDKAVAGGDINPVANVQNNYTPGTDAAASAFNAAVGQQAPAAAGPALSGSAGDFEGVSFASTPITSQAAAGPALAGGYSPVVRAMSPFERTLAAASRPPTADEQLADLARTNRGAALQQYLDVNPNQSLSYANTYLNALISADNRAAIPSSPEFDQRFYSPVDSVNIFDQFEQPLDANNPPTARDPSRPMTEIRAATPAEQITTEARAAANQVLGPDRTRPTAAEVAAAEQRLTARTPGLQEAIAGGIMPANIEGMYGMQPTTTEVDAYNQAINEQIAAQLGVDSYSPGSFNAMKEVQDRALAGQYNVVGLPGAEIPGATRPMDFSDIEAMDLADQGIIAAVQAAKEVELETGVPAQEVAGIVGLTGPAVSTSRTPQEMALTGSQTFDARPADQATPVDVARFTDPLTGGISDTPTLMSDIMDYYDERGSYAQIMNTLGDDAYRSRAEDGSLTPGVDYEIEDSRENVPGRAALNDIDRAIAEEEAFRAAQQTEPEPGAADLREVLGRQDIFASPLGFDETDLATMPDESVGIRGIRADNLERAAQAQRAIDFEPNPATPGATMILGAINSIDSLLGGNQAQKMMDVAARKGGQFVNLPGADNVRVGAIGPSLNPFSNDLVYVGDPAGFAEAKKIADEKGLNLTTGAGTQDPISGMREGDPGVDYSRQGLMDTGDGGDGGTPPILPPIEEPPAEAPPEEYQGRDVVKPYQYQPRGPLTYAYTGLPSLAPTRLRPSYTARKTFSPLFPVS
jgi:hypothetical protein